MQSLVQESHADRRRASRHPVCHVALFEHANGDEFKAEIGNLSAQGFMLNSIADLEKGDRVTVRLPVIGRIEAYHVWSHNGRSGFKFERIIRLPDFMEMLDKLG